MARKKNNIESLLNKADKLSDQQQLNVKGGYFNPRIVRSSFWWERGGGIIDDDIDIRSKSQSSINHGA